MQHNIHMTEFIKYISHQNKHQQQQPPSLMLSHRLCCTKHLQQQIAALDSAEQDSLMSCLFFHMYTVICIPYPSPILALPYDKQQTFFLA